MLRIFVSITTLISARMADIRQDDRGMTTETVIITGALALAAGAALVVIGGAIANRAQDSADTIEGGLGVLGFL